MADKAISELPAAEQITPTDLLVLEQDGVAKKLTGRILKEWLRSIFKEDNDEQVTVNVLKSSDGYTMLDSNGLYIIPKESE